MGFKLLMMNRCEQSQRNEKSFAGWSEIQLSPHPQTITLSHFQDFVIIGATLKVIETFELSYGLTEDESDE